MEPSKIIEDLLAASKTSDLVVAVRRNSAVNLRWANNTSTTNGAMDGWALRIVAIDDGRVSSIGTTLQGDEDPVAILRAAEAACSDKPVAPDALPLLAGTGDVPAEFDTPRSAIEPDALDVDAVARLCNDAKSADLLTYGYVEHERHALWLGTSAGVRRSDEIERARFDFTTKSSDRSKSTWEGSFVDETFDAGVAFAAARRRLEWSETQVSLEPGDYEVLLSPSCVADMLTYMMWMATLREAREGRSAFSRPGGTMIGERLSEMPVTIVSDPSAEGLPTIPFVAAGSSDSYSSVFDAGVSVEPTTWVREGVLERLIAPRKIANDAGTPPAHFAGNILVPSTGPSLDEMIASTTRGLLLNSLWYIRMVDPQSLLLTGLTRDGVYLVEDGKVVGEVNNFRFNMSPLTMLKNIEQIGQSRVVLPREFETSLTHCPPMRVRDWRMSSVSDAR